MNKSFSATLTILMTVMLTTQSNAVRYYDQEDIGIAQSMMYDDLTTCSGSLVRHPVNDHLLFITAAHCIKPKLEFLIGLGKTTFVKGALGGMIKKISEKQLIAFYPPEEGDVAVYDITSLPIIDRNDAYIKILQVKNQFYQGDELFNYGFVGGFSDLAIRDCSILSTMKDYNNGIQLVRAHCSVPDELRDLLADKNSRDAHGTSGGPLVIKEEKYALAGTIRGGFNGSLTDKGIAVFDLEQILEQQKNTSRKAMQLKVSNAWAQKDTGNF